MGTTSKAYYDRYNKAYYQAYAAKIKEHVRFSQRRNRLEWIKLLGGKCALCGNKDIRVLEIDHIEGDAWVERKVLGYKIHVPHLNPHNIDTSEYQILCANCHKIKTYENGEHAANKWQLEDTPERIRMRDHVKRHRQKNKMLWISLIGNRCSECNVDDIRLLELHHVNCDAHKDREKGYRNMWLTNPLKQDISRFKLLCANCHTIRTYHE